MEIVKHKLKDWLDLFFGIPGEMSKSGVLRTALVNEGTKMQSTNLPMDRFRGSIGQHTSLWQQRGSVDIS